MTTTKQTSEKMRLLKANGEIAYLWAMDEDVVKAVRAFLQYLDEPTDSPGDADKEVELHKAMRDALASTDEALHDVLPPPIAHLIAAAPALLAAAKGGLAELETHAMNDGDMCCICEGSYDGHGGIQHKPTCVVAILRAAIALAEEVKP